MSVTCPAIGECPCAMLDAINWLMPYALSVNSSTDEEDEDQRSDDLQGRMVRELLASDAIARIAE